MKHQRFLLLSLLIIGVLSHFLPWFFLGIATSISGVESGNNYMPTFIIWVIAIGLVLGDGPGRKLSRMVYIITLFLTLLAALVIVLDIAYLFDQKGSFEYGVFVWMAAGLLTPIILILTGPRKDQSSNSSS